MMLPFMRRRRPRIPPGQRVYAIGDVHGCYNLLGDLFLKITDEQPLLEKLSTHFILLGDLIDRGPQSDRVLHLAQRAKREEVRMVVLKGNHEDALVAAWRGDREALAGWLASGGVETLVSFGADRASIDARRNPERTDAMLELLRDTIPPATIDWLDALPLVWSCGDYVFAHAGIRPGIPLDRQEPTDLLWIRDDFLDFAGDHGGVIVHGHSISDSVDFRSNRIGVDTGAYATGRLSAVCLCDDRQRAISVERIPDKRIGTGMANAS